MDPMLLGTVAQAGQNLQDNVFSGIKGIGGLLYNEFQYGRQKRDALEFWRMQNEYNSPVAQMQRLRDAGLNPNLVYGRGAGAVGEASPPKVPDPTRTEFPDFRSGVSPLFAGYDLQIKQAQTDNLRAQNTVLLEEALLRNAQTKDTIASASRKGFDLELDKELRDVSAEYRREMLREKSAQIDVLLNRDEREAAMTASSLREAVARIAQMRQLTMNAEIEAEIKKLDLDLYEKTGIRPGDPYWLRLVSKFVDTIISQQKSGSFFYRRPKFGEKKGGSW